MNSTPAPAAPPSGGKTCISHDVESHACPSCWMENEVKRLYIPLLIESGKPWHCWKCAAPIHLSDPEAERLEAERSLTPNERDILAALPRCAEDAMTAQQLADVVACSHGTARNLLGPRGALRRHHGVISAPGGGYYLAQR